MNNKKLAILALVMVLLVSSLAAAVYARSAGQFVDDIMGKVGSQLKSAQTGDTGFALYDRHKITIDFFIMFILFFSIAYLGLHKFMGKEGGNAAKGVAFAVGVALSVAALKAGISPAFFIPFVKNALFFIIFMVMFLLLKQMFGEGKTVHAFVVALIMTWIAFNVFNVVLDADKKFDIGEMLSVPTSTKMDNIAGDRVGLVRNLEVMAVKHGIKRNELPENYTDRVKFVKDKLFKDLEELDRTAEDYSEKSKPLIDDLKMLDDYGAEFDKKTRELEEVKGEEKAAEEEAETEPAAPVGQPVVVVVVQPAAPEPTPATPVAPAAKSTEDKLKEQMEELTKLLGP